MLRTWPTTTSHEELFIERYAQLLRWSLKLANGDRQLAEDVVHDAFIQFTLGRPDLDGIQNLDGYLYTTLRNRFLSHIRRSAKSPVDRLSAVDYDSAEISLRASDSRSLMLVHEELHLICRYACERKETSKAEHSNPSLHSCVLSRRNQCDLRAWNQSHFSVSLEVCADKETAGSRASRRHQQRLQPHKLL